jgi:hypothetical protein
MGKKRKNRFYDAQKQQCLTPEGVFSAREADGRQGWLGFVREVIRPPAPADISTAGTRLFSSNSSFVITVSLDFILFFKKTFHAASGEGSAGTAALLSGAITVCDKDGKRRRFRVADRRQEYAGLDQVQ